MYIFTYEIPYFMNKVKYEKKGKNPTVYFFENTIIYREHQISLRSQISAEIINKILKLL